MAFHKWIGLQSIIDIDLSIPLYIYTLVYTPYNCNIYVYPFNFRTDLITKGAYIVNLVVRLTGVALYTRQITVLVEFGRYYSLIDIVDIIDITDIADIRQSI